jgi:CheY-like chemotaxis protein
LLFQLGSAGIDVRTYESAVVFLEVAPTIQTGCIITDVRMPELSGIDLLRRVRELKLAVPVIVITAHGDIPLAVEAMRLGAVDFLEKPFEDEVLLASVRSALDGGIEIKSVRPSAAISRAGSRHCRTASAMSSRDWSLDMSTSCEPVRSGAHGPDRGDFLIRTRINPTHLERCDSCPTHPAGTFADLSHIKAAVLILVLFAAQRGYPEPRVQAKSNEKSRRIVAVGSSRHRH